MANRSRMMSERHWAVIAACALLLTGCISTQNEPESAGRSAPSVESSEKKHPRVSDFKALGPGARMFHAIFVARPALTMKEFSARNHLDRGKNERDQSPAAISEANYVAEFLSGRTVTSFDTQHGLQVTYFAPDGEVYLWYPGNSQTLKGQWTAIALDNSYELLDPVDGWYRGQVKDAGLCYKYGQGTYNPSTRSKGGTFECHPYSRAKQIYRENRKGDVFSLATRTTPPFVLTKAEMTIDALHKRAKVGN